MKWERSLFDDTASDHHSKKMNMEVPSLDRLLNLEEKITAAVERVKALKEDKALLEKKIKELESALNEKHQEVEWLKSEKSSIGNQLEELLNELDSLEA
jgi:chromosome segregation ATPase